MSVWVYLLVHDRSEELYQTLRSFQKYPAGAPFRWAVHLDAPDPDTEKVAQEVTQNADVVLTSAMRVGAATAMNRLLGTRAGGEHVLRMDSDTKWRTNNWLKILLGDLENYGVIFPAARTESWHPHYRDVECAASGATLYRSDVLERLGRFHVYGRYGCEDVDYSLRANCAGFAVAVNREVRVKTAPSNADARREETEDALRKFKAQETKYKQGLEIHQ